MTLLTIAVMILAVVHAVTPALLPHSHTITLPVSFSAASQVNTRSFERYDHPTPRPPQNTYPTHGYKYSTPKTYSLIPQVVTTPKNNYLSPETPRKIVPHQVQYYTSTPHTPFIQNVATPTPPQIRNVYVDSHVRSKRIPYSKGSNSRPYEPRKNVMVPDVETYSYTKSLVPFAATSSGGAPTATGHGHGTPYQYRYLVQNENEGVDFNEDKVSDGETVRGEYRVLLPDGRRQIVRYVADSINGYNAVVEYEGTAVYPDQVARLLYAI